MYNNDEKNAEQMSTTHVAENQRAAAELCLTRPIQLCQKDHPNLNFKKGGCAVTCGIMVAASRDRRSYSITDFDGYANGQKIWYISGEYVNYTWLTPTGWSFVKDTTPSTIPGDAETVEYIKRYINAGQYAICYCPGNVGHWMVAYGYTSGSTFDSIRIIDPADGQEKSLAKGMEDSCYSTSAGISVIRACQKI